MGDYEAALGMGGGSRELEVVAAQNPGDLAQGVRAFRLGLALGEEDETLAANGTTHIRRVGCAFAQDLHQESLSFVPVEFQPKQGSLPACTRPDEAQSERCASPRGRRGVSSVLLAVNRFSTARARLARRKSRA